MNMEIDDLESLHDGVAEPVADPVEDQTTQEAPETNTDDLPTDSPATDENTGVNDEGGIDELFAQHGIQNRMISYEEDGEVVTKSFDELDEQEKLNIVMRLASLESDEEPEVDLSEYGLSERDEAILADLLKQGVSLEEYLSSLQSNEPAYKVDDLSDDEVFVVDFRNRIPDITDEDLLKELEEAKESKYYQARVNNLRDEYKQLEDEYETYQQQEVQQAEYQQYEQERNLIVEAATEINNLHGIGIDESQRDQILEQLVEIDEETGNSQFIDYISNPETMFKAAWYLNYGDQVFHQMQNYYAKEIKDAYDNGKKEAMGELSPKPINAGSNTTRPTNKKESFSIEDLHNKQ